MNNRLMAIAVLAAVLGTPALGGSLAGRVTEDTTGAAIAGAVVTVHVLLPDSVALPDTSDGSGLYAIQNIPPANQIYVIMAFKAGYRHFYFRYDQLGSESVQFDVVLQRESSTPPGGGGDSTPVAGQVFGRQEQSGAVAPLPGAEVRLASGGSEYTAWTDAAGRYSVTVPKGNYAITVAASGYTPSGSNGVAVESEGLSYGIILREEPTAVPGESPVPGTYVLHEAYPQPFNPSTTISLDVPVESRVRLRMYDLIGREVRDLLDGVLPPGTHLTRLEAGGLASGAYIIRLEAQPLAGGEVYVAHKWISLVR